MKTILGLSALALASVPAAGQTPGVLFRDGDPIVGVGGIERISYVRVTDSGMWLSLVEADNSVDNNLDICLMRNGFLTLREGMNLPQPPGTTLDDWGSIHMNSRGELGMHLRPRTTTTSDGLYWNLVLVQLKGDVLNLAPFSANARLDGVTIVRLTEERELIGLVKVLDTTISNRAVDALIRYDLGPTGSVLARTTLATKNVFNDVLGAPIDTLGTVTTPEHSLAVNQLGDFVLPVSGIGARAIMVNMDRIVARELEQSPAPGRTWNANAFALSKVDINDSGDVVYTGTLTPIGGDAGEPTNFLLVKNDQKIIQSGDVIPALSPATVGKGSPVVAISNRGDVFWRAQPTSTTAGGAAFMRNLTPLIQESVTTVEGIQVKTVNGSDDAFAISPEGRFFLGRVILQSVTDVDAVIYLDFGLVSELPGCFGNQGKLLHLSGDARVGQQLRIGMDDGPFPGALPILLFSRNTLLNQAGCGVPTTTGELMLGSPVSNPFFLPAWDGVNPSVFTVNVPVNMSLVNAKFYVQGLFGNPNQPRSFKLTNGLKYEIGPP
ncbi:MAG TPA: hypothetical protein VF530_09820 [Planctomycetota bacterium]